MVGKLAGQCMYVNRRGGLLKGERRDTVSSGIARLASWGHRQTKQVDTFSSGTNYRAARFVKISIV